MTTYTLTSYEPVALELPKPQVPDSLVDAQIAKMLEPLATYHEVAEDRGVLPGDFLVVTTHDPALDGNPARNFLMEHSLYHVGAGEMPKTFDDELIGVKPGDTKQVRAAIKMPLGAQGGHVRSDHGRGCGEDPALRDSRAHRRAGGRALRAGCHGG